MDMTPKTKETEASKQMGLCQAKKLLKSNRNHHQDEKANCWVKKTFANQIPNEELTYKIHKRTQITQQQKTDLILKGAEDLNRYFFKKDKDTVNKH